MSPSLEGVEVRHRPGSERNRTVAYSLQSANSRCAHLTSNPGLFTVTALADAFGVSIDELVREARGAEEAGIVSAGYEGRNIEQFVEQLLARNVRTVADVRLTPLSRKPGFSKTKLTGVLAEAGISYRPCGRWATPRRTARRSGRAGPRRDEPSSGACSTCDRHPRSAPGRRGHRREHRRTGRRGWPAEAAAPPARPARARSARTVSPLTRTSSCSIRVTAGAGWQSLRHGRIRSVSPSLSPHVSASTESSARTVSLIATSLLRMPLTSRPSPASCSPMTRQLLNS
ncbi:hypothetical protein M2158_004583 [Streptomyces sp. SAI-144]|nr:hypothetical protein [Streptomyces sp. SAI-144]